MYNSNFSLCFISNRASLAKDEAYLRFGHQPRSQDVLGTQKPRGPFLERPETFRVT